MAHIQLDHQPAPVANIFCIGRNYAAHVAELGNAPNEAPLVFLKPTSSLLHAPAAIELPSTSQDIHYETELVLYIGRGGRDITEADALSHIAGYGIGLDLTARDIQDELKKKGHPWTRCKGFPHAACVSAFIPANQVSDPSQLQFTLDVNGERRQHGQTQMMLYSITRIIAELSQTYGLSDGDLIYTGTPEGVGRLHPQDRLTLDLNGLVQAEFTVA